MITTFLAWAATLLSCTIDWLSSMSIVDGVSVLGFMVAVFVLGLLIRNLIFKAQ